MDGLPLELISEIVSAVRYERASLYSLCLTSKRFLLDARRDLYRSITISLPLSGIPFGSLLLAQSQGDMLFATFIEFNSSLARFVHTFTYAARLLDGSWNRSRLTRLAMSLELMVNLKNFGFFSTSNVSPVPLGEILKSCTFRLESFETWGISQKHDLSPATIRECLLHQPQLKKLQLLWQKNTPFPDDCCPNLEILAGNQPAIDAILPTARPITHIILSDTNYIAITPSQRLRNLHTLCVRSWESGCERQMQTLFRHLTGLQVLHYARVQPVRFVRRGRDLTYVSRLPSLRVFILSAQKVYYDLGRQVNSDIVPDHCHPPDSNTIQEWLKDLPHLRVVYIQISDAFRNERSFLAWERSKDGPTMVEGAEVWNISPWL